MKNQQTRTATGGRPPLELSGRTFGLLTVLEPGPKHTWICVCACGARCVRQAKRLTYDDREGRVSSCGCYRRDPEVRRAARLVTPAARRSEIAHAGGEAARAAAAARAATAARAAQLIADRKTRGPKNART